MSKLLIEHAKNHVWQEPSQDHQFHIGLGRLTKNGGFHSSTKVGWHKVLSPTRHEAGVKYHHIYQIGQIGDITLNLVNILTEDEWMPAEDIVNNHNVFIQVYMLTGAVIPLKLVWLMRDFTNNLLVCIHNNKTVDYGRADGYIDPVVLNPSPYTINLDNSKLVIRFYTNAIQHNSKWSSTSGVPNDSIETCSSLINNQADYNKLIAKLGEIRRKYRDRQNRERGEVFSYIDGFYTDQVPSYSNTLSGKILSFVYDETIAHKQLFNLKHMPVFKSKLDLNQTKYLALLNTNYDTIIHQDDIDIYLYNRRLNKGVYISRTHQDHVRQVVHNGYAIDTHTVQYYINLYDWTNDINELCLMLLIRTGGMQKAPFNQANRVDELFRLPYLNVLNVFLNTDSDLMEWKASELENSMYMKLVSSKGVDITSQMVAQGYGYAGIVQSLLNPQLTKVSNSQHWLVPEGINWPNPSDEQIHKTVFCFDDGGMLLGYYSEFGDKNRTQPPTGLKHLRNTRNVEMFRLKSSVVGEQSGVVVNNDVQDIRLTDYGYACYISPEGSSDWKDVTGTAFYTFVPASDNNGIPKIKWNWSLLTASNSLPCVKINSHMLIHRQTSNKAKQVGYYEIVVRGTYYNANELVTDVYNLPVGKVEVFANGYSLIEGIDYYCNFPKIVITNQLISKLESVDFIVRCYGLANPKTSKHYPPTEVGFIRGGWLSADGKYSIAKHRPNFVVVNSKRRWNHHDYGYAAWMEYYQGNQTNSNHRLEDGRPYMIQDYIVPIEHVSPTKTTEMYEQMVDTDTRLSQYLNQFIPQRAIENPRAITNRWQLVSPLISAMLHSIKNGGLASVSASLTMEDVELYLRGYKWLLEYDPAYHNSDMDYTYVLPHPYFEAMRCNIAQYQLLERIIHLYLNDRIDLSKHVQVI